MNRLLYRLRNGSGHLGDAIEKSHLARTGLRVGFSSLIREHQGQ